MTPDAADMPPPAETRPDLFTLIKQHPVASATATFFRLQRVWNRSEGGPVEMGELELAEERLRAALAAEPVLDLEYLERLTAERDRLRAQNAAGLAVLERFRKGVPWDRVPDVLAEARRELGAGDTS